MTNNELFNTFKMIEIEADNVFDKYCRLQELENSYKTTEFAKMFANYSVLDAYKLYIEDSTSMGTLLRDFKNVDLPNLLSIIADKLDVSKQLENLDGETAELLKLILEQNN